MSSFIEQSNLPVDAQAPEIVTNEADKTMGYAETARDENELREESHQMQELVHYIKSEYSRSKIRRRSDEERWLECFRNYRGIYGPDVQFTSTEKSRAFIRITKTKVLAAYAQILDILFGTSAFPLGVEPTPVPKGIAENVYYDPKEPSKEEQGIEPEKSVERTATVARKEILDLVGPLRKSLSRIKDKVQEGIGKTPTALNFEPAKEAALKLQKEMLDQLEEAGASKSIRSTIFEMCLFGTGVYKGPFVTLKEYPKWTEDGEYKPELASIPDFSHVSIWDTYPDADARTPDEIELLIQRHRMNRTQLRALKRRPMFRKDTIEYVIKQGPDYTQEWWEDSLRDDQDSINIKRWEVLEFWGIVDKDIAEQAGLEIPQEYEDFDQVQINAWICQDQILRLVLNPFTPARIPYHIVPYEFNPYSIFGIGVAENMLDTQLLMNGFFRLAIDNAVLSSNLIFEINEDNLVPGQDMEVYPGKIFRTSGQLGQSINSIKFDNITQECLLMFDKARQLADEATGMPSYSHGISGVMGVGRTASGMSMLMGAAKENIKAVVRNIDDYLLIPLGKGLYAFNMQFNFNKDFIGDLEIVAKGTESLMRNEVRSQKLLQFYQITSNPMDAPWVKRDYLLRELALSLDLEPDKVVNDQREAAIQAEILSQINQQMGVDPSKAAAQAGAANPSGVPSLSDPTGGTGGGNAVPGQAPVPQEQGFTGTGGGSNIQQPQGAVQ